MFFVPIFFVVVRKIFKSSKREQERFAEHAAQSGITPEAARHYVEDAETNLSDDDRRALHGNGDAPKDHP